MSLHLYGLIFLAVLINSAAQLLLKAGLGRIGHFSFVAENIIPVGLKMALSPFIFMGLCCYILSVVVWMMVLSRAEVSVAYPTSSIGYVVTAMAAFFIFGENLTPMRILGILVIMLGVYLISRTA